MRAARAETAAARGPAAAWSKLRTGLARLADLGRGGDHAAPLPVRDQINVGGARPVRLMAFDQPLLAVVMTLLLFGLVMIFSASVALADGNLFRHVRPDGTVLNITHTHFLVAQLRALAIASIAALIVVQVPTAVWEKFAPAIFVAALALLVCVLFFGNVVNNSRRWLPLGVMNFQPSELTKLAIAMYAANYMVRKMDTRDSFFRAVWPMAVAVAVVGVLLMRQPDMGAFLVILTIALGILFLGGVNARMFALMALVVVVTVATYLYFDDLRRERILAYLQPFAPEYAQGKGYQLVHSLIALARGAWFGQGLGASIEKLHYLPEAHTDFLVAVIGEELGLVGVATVIGLFFWLTRRLFIIGRQAVALDRIYAGLFVQGVGIWFGIQAFINIGVNIGALPTKGLTLPLMSYGGSALLMNLIALAMVVRVDVENRSLMRGGAV